MQENTKSGRSPIVLYIAVCVLALLLLGAAYMIYVLMGRLDRVQSRVASMEKNVSVVSAHKGEIEDMGGELEALKSGMPDWQKNFQITGENIQALDKALGSLNAKVTALSTQLADLDKSSSSLRNAASNDLTKLNTDIKDLASAVSSQGKVVEALRNDIQNTWNRTANVSAQVATLTEDSDDQSRRIDRLVDALEKASQIQAQNAKKKSSRRSKAAPLPPPDVNEITKQLSDFIIYYQRLNVRTSFGQYDGECFSEDDLKTFSNQNRATAIAAQAKETPEYRSISEQLIRLTSQERREVFQSVANTSRPTWDELGKITPDGQTQAGHKAELQIASAIIQTLSFSVR